MFKLLEENEIAIYKAGEYTVDLMEISPEGHTAQAISVAVRSEEDFTRQELGPFMASILRQTVLNSNIIITGVTRVKVKSNE